MRHTFNNSNNADIAKRELVTRLNTETGGRISSNCSTTGDFLCDTPADPRQRTDGTSKPSACVYNGNVVDANGDLFNPLVNNVMDYNFCQEYSFTPQQFSRMNDTYNFFTTDGSVEFSFTDNFTSQPAPTNVEVTLLNTTVNVGATISWNESSTVESGYFVERATASAGPYSIVGGVGPNEVVFTDLNIEIGQTYYYRVKPSNNPNVFSNASGPIAVTANVCGVNFSDPCASDKFYINIFRIYEGIYNYTSGIPLLLENFQSGCSENGYGDFYNDDSKTATLTAGNNYKFFERPPYHNPSGFNSHFCSVYIDYNGDGDFEDANEAVFEADTRQNTFKDIPFTVPSNVDNKEVRLRVINNDAKIISNPCDYLTNGEYEDYKIVLANPALGIDEVQIGKFQLYPNPNNGEKIVLSGNNINSIQDIKLYSTDGRQIVVNSNINSGKLEIIPGNTLNSGLYIFVIKTDTETLSKKVIVK